MELLIDALLQWIGDNSEYQTGLVEHPAVVELSPQELTREFYTGVAHLIPADGVDERLNALYAITDGPNGTIYLLRAEFIDGADHFEDPTENPLFREILLHELVHHVQHVSGASDAWPCLAMGEREAYALGGVYLRQVAATDPLPNRNFWGAMYSRC